MVLNHLTAPVLTSSEAPPLQEPEHKSKSKERTCPDPNIPDHRLNINRPCIYERRLPGNAYITAHVQRLQHGHYSTTAVSDRDIDHADFLAVSFVFHSPDTIGHRFKAATIRASLHSPSHNDSYTPKNNRHRSSRLRHHPHFLMHAPHLLYGSVSPETLTWSYSLAGSLGIAQLPLFASISPAAGLNGRFSRYEMMRIQGSVRTSNSKPASQIVWTLEENTLQRSGLPREFTFAMLIAKSTPESRVQFVLEIEPVLQSWFGSYPGWWLALWRRYRAVRRKRAVDFRSSVGQRFGPASSLSYSSSSSSSKRGFNFATLVAGFDEYVSLPGKRVMAAAGGTPQDQQQPDDPMPLPLPMPNPNPNPNPGMPMPMPMPYPPEQGLWPRQPRPPALTPCARGGVNFQSSNVARTGTGTGIENVQTRSYHSKTDNDSSTQRNRPRRGYYQPR